MQERFGGYEVRELMGREPRRGTKPGGPADPGAVQVSIECVTCGAARSGPYCAQCGQHEHKERHSLGRFLSSVLQRVIGEDGVLNTVKELTLRPGQVVRDYLKGRTKPYVHPAAYLLIGAAALTLAARMLGDSTGAAESDEVFVLLLVPVIAGVSRLLFLRGPYNYAEHLIVLLYISGHSVLIFAAALLGMGIVPQQLFGWYFGACAAALAAYFIWAYSAVFGRPRWRAIVAGVLALVGGIGTWLAAMTVLVRLFQR